MIAVFDGGHHGSCRWCVLRDVLVNEVPRAFHDHQPYAAIAFAGGWVLVLLGYLNTPEYLDVAHCGNLDGRHAAHCSSTKNSAFPLALPVDLSQLTEKSPFLAADCQKHLN